MYLILATYQDALRQRMSIHDRNQYYHQLLLWVEIQVLGIDTYQISGASWLWLLWMTPAVLHNGR